MDGPDVGFEQLEHTADVGLHVWAPDLNGLFAEAARAVIAVMGDVTEGAERVATVELDAPDVEALLVDWLSEVLFLFEARDLAAVRGRLSVERNPWRLRGEAAGPPAEAIVQHGPAVKAVTYHGLRVIEQDERVDAWVYLDI